MYLTPDQEQTQLARRIIQRLQENPEQGLDLLARHLLRFQDSMEAMTELEVYLKMNPMEEYGLQNRSEILNITLNAMVSKLKMKSLLHQYLRANNGLS